MTPTPQRQQRSERPASAPQEDGRPVRVQRSRAKGSKLPPNTVCVTRPGLWGNPFRAEVFGLETSLALYRETVLGGWDPKHVKDVSDELCDEAYRLSHAWRKRFVVSRGWSAFDALQFELRGKDLACWCPLPAPGEPDLCHATILLELAQRPTGGRDAK